jgi:amino acid adenylation domain-containing protein
MTDLEGKEHVLSAADRHKLLFEWNQTQVEYPRNSCFHQLFEAQVKRTPYAVAVECEDKRLTYQELNLRANRLAHHLRTLGVRTDALVGICVEPSLDMVVGLLGILKAGGAYVPLDPKYPKERLSFMIKDAAMPVLLTQEKLLPVLSTGNARAVCLETISPIGAATEELNPDSGVTPENLAYVIYTSGSTGQPKGVMIPHRGLVNYLTWAAAAYHVAEGVGAPVHSSLSFDLTITGLFTPLLVGRCVYVLPTDFELTGLSGALRKPANFSLVKITPAHLDLLRAQLSADEVSGRTGAFVIGGEALLGENLAFWQDRAPETVLVNEYGPTETVVGCCVYFVPKSQRTTGPVLIGRPIANTQLYVLDPELMPVPIGAKGELYIGGDGVARGYLNRPGLTAQCFIPNPFANYVPGSSDRLYKTGDLVRYQADGNLEFLGRVDDQVKIRGYRIELGEIESVLATHPRLNKAVVVGHEDAVSGKYLAAYVQARGQPAPSPTELSQFLRSKLPDYMVPAAFVMRETFPLTQNGKVDRRALPPPDLKAVSNGDYVAPRTENERKLAQIWADVFKRPKVGVHDNFLDLGGHSLLGARLLAEVNRTFTADLRMLSLFEFPTVEKMARALQQSLGPRPKLARLSSTNNGRPFIFLNAPMESVNLFRLIDTPRSFFITECPFSPKIVLAATVCDWNSLPTVEEIAAPHVAAIRGTTLSGPCIIAGYSYNGILAFEVAHQLQSAGIPVEGVFFFDSHMKWSHLDSFKRWPFRHARNCLRFGFRFIRRKVSLAIRWERARLAAKLAAKNSEAPAPAASVLSDRELPWELIVRIWTHALKRYRPKKLTNSGVLFRAEISLYRKEIDYDGCLGWSSFFTKPLRVADIPGNHDSMWREPDLQVLGKACAVSVAAFENRPNAK